MTCQEFLALKNSNLRMQSFSLYVSKEAKRRGEPTNWINRGGYAIRDHNLETLEAVYEKIISQKD